METCQREADRRGMVDSNEEAEGSQGLATMKSYKGAVSYGSSSGNIEGPQHFEMTRGSWRRGSGRRGRGRYQYRNQMGYNYQAYRRGGMRLTQRMEMPLFEEDFTTVNPRVRKGMLRDNKAMDPTVMMLEALNRKGKEIKDCETELSGDQEDSDGMEQNIIKLSKMKEIMSDGMDIEIDKYGSMINHMKESGQVMEDKDELKDENEKAMEELNIEGNNEGKKQGARKKLNLQQAMVVGKASRRIMKSITSPRKGTTGRTRSKESKKEEDDMGEETSMTNKEMDNISDTTSKT